MSCRLVGVNGCRIFMSVCVELCMLSMLCIDSRCVMCGVSMLIGVNVMWCLVSVFLIVLCDVDGGSDSVEKILVFVMWFGFCLILCMSIGMFLCVSSSVSSGMRFGCLCVLL